MCHFLGFQLMSKILGGVLVSLTLFGELHFNRPYNYVVPKLKFNINRLCSYLSHL